mgnify:FL=1
MITLKKLFTALLFFVLSFTCTFASAASYTLYYNGAQHEYNGNSYQLYIDGNRIYPSVEPLIFNDYTLVPIRDVFEEIGAHVNYINITQQIYINYNSNNIRLQIGNNTALINSKEIAIPGGITPMLISVNGSDAKTMVPLRFISEQLGFTVTFNADEGAIGISTAQSAKKAMLNDYKFYAYNDLITTIEVYSDSPLQSMTDPILTESNVLYFDIPNCGYQLPNSTDIGIGAARFIRFGSADNRTRIAVDVSNLQRYSVTLSDDKKVILMSLTANPPEQENVPQTPVPTGGKTVVIDAGHGGTDPGASGSTGGKTYQEKAINLSVARKVRDILVENGVNVIMTREGDTYPTLTERSDIANLHGAVIFTSIHSNSANSSSATGFEVYYSNQNNSNATGLSSSELASSVSRSIAQNINLRNRGVKTADHVVTRTCTMPAILVEIGFVSTPDELSLMITDDFQNSFAKGVADGILNVIGRANIPG